MPDHHRRDFLRCWAAGLGTVALPGLGQAAPPPNAAAAGPMRFSVRSDVTQKQAAFTLGFVFPQGRVAAGATLHASAPDVQAVVKNHWPDGSARFAIVSGLAPLTAGEALEITLGAGAAPAAAPVVSLAQLKATRASAAIEAGSWGRAAWTGADWDTPFATWITGPRMSSWIYRKPVGNDAHLVAWLEVRLYANGALEVLPWVENGYLRVPAPANRSASYSFSLNGKPRFSQEIDLPYHCRTPLLDDARLSHWLGEDPGVVARQDARLLMATEMVPNYIGRPTVADIGGRALPASFTPLQQGGYSNTMGQTGYHPAIGLLPAWDVGFLVCDDDAATTYGGMLRNAFSAGRFPVHYRDETTHRPLRFSQYPHLSLNSSTKSQYPPKASGTSPPGWDIPHHPSIGYLAYLTTGRWYFIEQLQFAATRNFLHQVDDVRGFSKGLFQSFSGAATVRGSAWAWRTLAQVAVATPDDDPLRPEFIASLAANIEFNHATYVAQPNNPFGFVAAYGSSYNKPGDNNVIDAPWQQDFYTAAVGYALAMQPNVGADSLRKLAAFFAWKARSIIGRLGGTAPTEWLYRDAGRYNFVVAMVGKPDWLGGTGPWAANWGVLYQATLGTPNPGEAGPLRGGNFPGGTSYWGNLLPAISYAVRHGVPGAAEAYGRLTGASNWPQVLSTFHKEPVWGVLPPGSAPLPVAALAPAALGFVGLPPAPTPIQEPRPRGERSPQHTAEPARPPEPARLSSSESPREVPTPPLATPPAWARGLPAWQWTPIAGTALSRIDPRPRPLGNTGPRSKIETWCGATLKRQGSLYLLGAAGGHADYAGNEVDALDLLADRPAWTQLRGPTPNEQIINEASFYLDNRPSATHTYYATQFIDRLDRMVVFASGGMNGPFPARPPQYPYTGTTRSFSFDLSRRDWDAPDYIAAYPGKGDPTACLCVRHPLTGDVYYSRNSGDGWWRWTAAANRWDRLSRTVRGSWYAGAAIDTRRDRMLVVGSYSPTAPVMFDLDGNPQPASFGGLGAEALTLSGYPGVVYDEWSDLFVVAFNDGDAIQLLTVRADDLHVARPALTGPKPLKRPNGIQNSLQYVPQLKGVVIANRHDGDVYFMRTG